MAMQLCCCCPVELQKKFQKNVKTYLHQEVHRKRKSKRKELKGKEKRDNREMGRSMYFKPQSVTKNCLVFKSRSLFAPPYTVFCFGRVEAEWKCGLIDSPSRAAAKGFGGHSANKVAEALPHSDST